MSVSVVFFLGGEGGHCMCFVVVVLVMLLQF